MQHFATSKVVEQAISGDRDGVGADIAREGSGARVEKEKILDI